MLNHSPLALATTLCAFYFVNFRTADWSYVGSIGSSSTKLVASPFCGLVYLVLEGQLTIGQLIAFRIISGNVVGPIIRLAGTWQTIQALQISVERLADVVDAPMNRKFSAIALPPIRVRWSSKTSVPIQYTRPSSREIGELLH